MARRMVRLTSNDGKTGNQDEVIRLRALLWFGLS
jgi:hypothetical protein